jgi:hypothetical protein
MAGRTAVLEASPIVSGLDDVAVMGEREIANWITLKPRSG